MITLDSRSCIPLSVGDLASLMRSFLWHQLITTKARYAFRASGFLGRGVWA